MPNVNAGNRLYLYRLLSQQLGVGKQTPMDKAEKVIENDGFVPSDLGFDDMRSLCEALPEFVKVTAFKGGYVYATVLVNPELDAMLQKAAKPAEKSAGKSFKRKGGKVVKPLKPRHVEPKVQAAPVEEPTAEIEVEIEVADAAEANPVGEVEAAATEAEPEIVAAPEPEATPAPEPEPEVVTAPEPIAAPGPVAAPEPKLEVAAASEPEPSITLTITYDPTPEPDPDFEPIDPATTAPAPSASRPQRTHVDLPQDFYSDVRCPDEQLSTLCQVLPLDVDPMATLEEDFRVARSTHGLEGTRSNVTFPLRYQRADGTPVTVTLRRTAKAAAGSKHWTLAEVAADAPETVGLEGLSRKVEGAWRAFASDEQVADVTSPEDELASFAVLGSWEKLLSELANLAASEDWGSDLQLLKDYLTMTFRRIRRQGRLSMTDDGSSAAFDTGLLTADGEPIAAVLEPHDGDIIWELTCFSTNSQGQPASYPAPFGVDALVEVLLADGGARARRVAQLLQRNPRTATCAYDAVADAVYALVPADGKALPFAAGANGTPVACEKIDLVDALACARVVSSDQPAWLK